MPPQDGTTCSVWPDNESMVSRTLELKIAEQRRAGPDNLPKARACADVIEAWLLRPDQMDAAIQHLRLHTANNWALTHALQFMSGRTAEFAVECSPPHDRSRLEAIRLIAKRVCTDANLGNGYAPTRDEVERLIAASHPNFTDEKNPAEAG